MWGGDEILGQKEAARARLEKHTGVISHHILLSGNTTTATLRICHLIQLLQKLRGTSPNGAKQECAGASGTPGGHSPARASRLHPSSARLSTDTSSFPDLFHLITSCDFLGTVHRNEQAAASGHDPNHLGERVWLHPLLLAG